MKLVQIILVSVLLLGPTQSSADIYKCVTDDGTVKFSDQPCGQKSEIYSAMPSADDLILQARPFRQALADPDRISTDLFKHSKRIGARILPRRKFTGSAVHVMDDQRFEWEIVLYFTHEKLPGWKMEMTYYRRDKGDSYELWLRSINIFLWQRPFSPPGMDYVTSLKKIGPGKWVAP